jgi:hypothetical protein
MENMCCLKTELKDGDIVEFGIAVFSSTDSATCAIAQQVIFHTSLSVCLMLCCVHTIVFLKFYISSLQAAGREAYWRVAAGAWREFLMAW